MGDSIDESVFVYHLNKHHGYRRMARAMSKMLGLLIEDDGLDFVRACGDVVCEICGLPFFDHPQLENGLVMGCDGTLLKL